MLTSHDARFFLQHIGCQVSYKYYMGQAHVQQEACDAPTYAWAGTLQLAI